MCGCATPTPTHLIFHQSTVLGVDASTSATQTGHTRIVVGYDRQTTAFIPKSRVDTNLNSSASPTPGAERIENEAMSAVSLSTIKIRGIGQTEVHERFATGEAAKNIARDETRMDAFTSASPTPTPSPSPNQ